MSQERLPSTSAAELSSESIEKLPGRITVSRNLGALTIDWSWRSGASVAFLTVFCTIWDTIVFGAIAMGALPVLFIITHGGAGVLLTYVLLTKLINRTRIEVTHHQVKVSVGPLPWQREKRFDIREAKQLFVKTAIQKNDDSTEQSFTVAVRQLSGDIDLVKSLQTAEQAKTIEALIEEYLQIEDRPVPGEFKG